MRVTFLLKKKSNQKKTWATLLLWYIVGGDVAKRRESSKTLRFCSTSFQPVILSVAEVLRSGVSGAKPPQAGSTMGFCCLSYRKLHLTINKHNEISKEILPRFARHPPFVGFDYEKVNL